MQFSRVRARLARSTLLRQTAAYGLTNAISAAIPMAVGPILTHYLVPRDYGIASLFTGAINFVSPIAGLGVYAAFRRRFYQKEQYHYASYVWSTSALCFAQSVLVTIVLMATHSLWGSAEVGPLWALAFLPWLFGRYLMGALSALLQLEGRPLSFGAFGWAQDLVQLVGALTLVIVFGYGWQGRVLGEVISVAVVGVASAWMMKGMLGPGAKWSLAMAKDAVVFGAPSVPYSLLDRTIQFGDRALVASIAGIDQAGLYTLGVQVSGLTTRVAGALQLSWQPWLFTQLEEGTPRAKRRVVVAFYVAAGTMLATGFGLWMCVRWLFPILIGDRYVSALVFLPWLCMGLAVRGIANLLSGLIVFAEKTVALTRIAITVGICHLMMATGLLWWHGARGAAQASFAAYCVNALLVWYRARKLIPLPGL
jgi:O-antigen/teichoic acid export membrane protein